MKCDSDLLKGTCFVKSCCTEYGYEAWPHMANSFYRDVGASRRRCLDVRVSQMVVCAAGRRAHCRASSRSVLDGGTRGKGCITQL